MATRFPGQPAGRLAAQARPRYGRAPVAPAMSAGGPRLDEGGEERGLGGALAAGVGGVEQQQALDRELVAVQGELADYRVVHCRGAALEHPHVVPRPLLAEAAAGQRQLADELDEPRGVDVV